MAVLDDWLTVIRDAMNATPMTPPSHIALGTGTTSVLVTDTGLDTEILRKACSNADVGTSTVSYSSVWSTAEGNGNIITEAGAVNAASGGTFVNREVFPGFNKTSDYELRVQIYILNENS